MYGRKYIFKGGTEKHYISWKNSSKTKQITKRHFHFKNIFTESFFNASRVGFECLCFVLLCCISLFFLYNNVLVFV